MMKSDQFKGYLFAILATVFFSNVYIFSKAALNEVHLIQFGFYWFLIAMLLNGTWAARNGQLKLLRHLHPGQLKVLGILGILEILTNSSFYLSIHIIPDPAVTSFLGNLYPVILTLGGVFLLRERFTWLESVGVLLALAGAFIISFTGGSTLKSMFIPGTLVVLFNAIMASSASLVGKVNIRKLSPELITLNHTVWLFLFSALLMVIYRKPLSIPPSAMFNIVVGSFLGPFLGVLMIYYSFKYIEASRSSIIQSLKGIVVLFGAWLYFGTLPLPHQVWGGLLTVAGVLVMTLAQARLTRLARKP